MYHRDRTEAGQKLASTLGAYASQPGVLVLALPRGGVPVGFEISEALKAGLDVFVVRKLGVPGHEELAMGAIASGGVRVLNQEVLNMLNISPDTVEVVASRELKELQRRERRYRGDRPPPLIRNQTIILTDDGLATGATMKAAILAVKQQSPGKIVVAVPVAAPSTFNEIANMVDEAICIVTPEPFYSVGAWYSDFSQTTDEEVRDYLERAARKHVGAA